MMVTTTTMEMTVTMMTDRTEKLEVCTYYIPAFGPLPYLVSSCPRRGPIAFMERDDTKFLMELAYIFFARIVF